MHSRGAGAVLLLVFTITEQSAARSQLTLTTVTGDTAAPATEARSLVDGRTPVPDHSIVGEGPLTGANITAKRKANPKKMKEGKVDEASELDARREDRASVSLGESLFTSGNNLATTLLNSGTSLGGIFFDSGLNLDGNKFTNVDGTQISSAAIGTLPNFDTVSVSVDFGELFVSLLPVILAVIIGAELLAGGGIIGAIIGGIIAIVKGKKKKYGDSTGFSSSGYGSSSSSYGDSSSDMYSDHDQSSYTAYRALEKAILKYQ